MCSEQHLSLCLRCVSLKSNWLINIAMREGMLQKKCVGRTFSQGINSPPGFFFSSPVLLVSAPVARSLNTTTPHSYVWEKASISLSRKWYFTDSSLCQWTSVTLFRFHDGWLLSPKTMKCFLANIFFGLMHLAWLSASEKFHCFPCNPRLGSRRNWCTYNQNVHRFSSWLFSLSFIRMGLGEQ